MNISAKQVERLTERIGRERVAERNADTAAYRDRPLARREDPPPDVAAGRTSGLRAADVTMLAREYPLWTGLSRTFTEGRAQAS